MKVLGILGWSGMGKTTLLERLVPELVERGLRVSLVKHSHKDIELDSLRSCSAEAAGSLAPLEVGCLAWPQPQCIGPAPDLMARTIMAAQAIIMRKPGSGKPSAS